MCRRYVVVLCLLGLVGLAFAAEAPAPAQETEESLKAIQDEADALRVRVKALTELTKFMSSTRTQVRGYCHTAGRYLVSLEKLDEFYNAKLTVAPSPAELVAELDKGKRFEDAGIVVPSDPMSFDTAVGIALELVKAEGYDPVDVADADELEMLKRMAQAHENLARKVFQGLRGEIGQAWAMRSYLESIGQLGGFKAFRTKVLKEAEDKRREREAAEKKREEARRSGGTVMRMAKKWEAHRKGELDKYLKDRKIDAAKFRLDFLSDGGPRPARRYYQYGTRYRRPAGRPGRVRPGRRGGRGARPSGRGGRGGPRGRR